MATGNPFPTFQSPSDVQQQMVAQELAQLKLAPHDEPTQVGLEFGNIFAHLRNRFRTGQQGHGFFHRMASGNPAGQAGLEAQQNQQILQSASAARDQALKAGATPDEANIVYAKAAAQHFAQAGRPQAATQLLQWASDRQATVDAQKAQIAKMKAQSRQANSVADVNEYKLTHPTANSNNRDAKIAAVTQQLVKSGMSPSQAADHAEGIVDGYIKMTVVPQTGEVRMTNTVTGKASAVPLGGKAPAPPAPPPGMSMWEAAKYGTGPVSAAIAAGSKISGAIGGPVDSKVLKARQVLRTGTQYMIRALSNNPRFPVRERDWLIKEVSTLPTLLDNTKAMHDRMSVLSETLSRWRQTAQDNANDANLPLQYRADQKAKVAEIDHFLSELSAPKEAATGAPSGSGPTPGTVEDGYKFKGGDPSKPENWVKQ